MPAGANKKREREYNKLVDEFNGSGRYKGREKQVAARIVNKQRARFGETKAARRQARQGEAEDKGLPIRNYSKLTVPQVVKRLKSKSKQELKRIKGFEQKHKGRKTLLQAIDHEMRAY